MRALSLLVALSSALIGCKDDRAAPSSPSSGEERDTAAPPSNSADAGTDASTADAGHHQHPEDSGGPTPEIVCTEFENRTAPEASRDLTWDFTFPLTLERCIQVKVGQTVTFTDGQGQAANWAVHSLQPLDPDSPIEHIDIATGDVLMTRAGTFGFYCVDHRQMRGAIRAIE